MKTLEKRKEINSFFKMNTMSTGSTLLDSYSIEDLRNLANDVVASSKLKGQNVKDFLLETRSW